MSKFFCESNCELNYKLCEELDINVIGMPYTQNGVEKFYDMGKDPQAMIKFYNDIRKGDSMVTNALNPQDYINYFEPVFAAGEDIINVQFSHGLSGTFDFLNQAVNELLKKYPERKFYSVDTKSISYGAGIQVYEAAKMHKAGVSDEKIVKFIEEFREKINTYFMVDDLKHLKKGGRISASTAFIGGLLNIKPILTIKDGKLEKYGKVSGKRKAVEFLAGKVSENKTDETFKYPIIVLNADSKSEASEITKKLKEKFGEKTEIWEYYVGPTIGTHCGPGTIAVIFIGKKHT